MIKDIQEGLIKQTYSTVRWYESIKFMQEQNTNSFFEIGFGSTLCGIIKRIDRNCTYTGVCVSRRKLKHLAKEIL